MEDIENMNSKRRLKNGQITKQPKSEEQIAIEMRASAEIQALENNMKTKEKQASQPKKITSETLRKANEILNKYKKGKAMLEKKIIANEEFWKLRQWNYMNDGKEDFKPATPWLWSCIQSRYSDAMDSYPTCNIQPRQMDDKSEAKKLSAIIPVILEQNRYEETYSDVAWYMLKQGGCAQGVFWDGSKHNGLGDVVVKKVDFINLFWESGITNIQDSPNLFHTELVNNSILEQRYPQCVGKLGGKNITLAKYLYDDNVDTSEKSVVVDWYYHTEYNGRKVLHYVKYVDDIVLYATENDTQIPSTMEVDQITGIPVEKPTGEPMAIRGLYDHAMYPFVVQSLFPIEGSLCGYGLTDIGRDTQIQIDKINKAITDNTIIGATPRYFIRDDGSVNEEEYSDISKDLIHVAGNIGEENIRPVDTKQLSSVYVDVLNYKIDELKHCTSNQDAANGVAPTGITAASAIAALQETAGKNARSSNKAFHRAFRDVCYQIIELIRQFYTIPRTFRICPEEGHGEQFVEFSNAGIVPQEQKTMGMNMGLRVPEFDIEVTTEKANPYKKMEINELALSFYNQGFFNPQMADQALACLNMMDFTHKDAVMQRIQQNGTLQQMLIQYQQIALQLASRYEPQTADALAQMILTQGGQPFPKGGEGSIPKEEGQEHPFVERARAEARNSTQGE